MRLRRTFHKNSERLNESVSRKVILVGVSLLLLSACTTSVVPSHLEDRVERDLTFLQVKKDPESYKGKIIVAGGVILSAKRLKEATRIEVLQLPLDQSLEPQEHLTDSEGRLLAFHQEFLDPATIPVGTRITLVGEVGEVITLPLDEVTYDYVSLEIKSLTVWPHPLPRYRYRPYPYFGAYWGPYWGPPYWGPWL